MSIVRASVRVSRLSRAQASEPAREQASRAGLPLLQCAALVLLLVGTADGAAISGCRELGFTETLVCSKCDRSAPPTNLPPVPCCCCCCCRCRCCYCYEQELQPPCATARLRLCFSDFSECERGTAGEGDGGKVKREVADS
eukprot:3183056-Rhodomonas_salina.1